jgi:hypothetical protein
VALVNATTLPGIYSLTNKLFNIYINAIMTTNVLFKTLLIILQTIFCLTCLIATIPNGYYNNLYGVPVFAVSFGIILSSLILINIAPNLNKDKIQKLLLHNTACSLLSFIPVIGWIAIIYNFMISLFVMNVTISSLITKKQNNHSNKDEEDEEYRDQDYSEKLFESIKSTQTSINQKKRKVVNKYSR